MLLPCKQLPEKGYAMEGQAAQQQRGGSPRRTYRQGGGGLSIGIIVLGLVAMYFGVDPRVVMQVGSQLGGGQVTEERVDYQPTAKERTGRVRVGGAGRYRGRPGTRCSSAWGSATKSPRWCSSAGAVQSACGVAQTQVGPFYCPGDHKVYIDLAFYDELQRRFKAPGDLAQAYVIAHEVGHHVQNLLGYTKKVPRGSKGADSATVRLELQADCLAGIWIAQTERAKKFLEAGDIDEALNAATAIGDDRLQRQATGHVRPDAFTHGTSEQRKRWLHKGMNAKTLEDCDTFKVRTL